MRTFNLKFLGVILFIMFFLVGGFFINTTTTEAATTVKSLGISYSMSSVISTTNTDGSVTTKVLIGCAPKSGDLYDINTGKQCTNNVKTTLVGCAAGSKDVYDVNTGIACASYIKSAVIGCAPKSGDVYDINTGNKCIINTPTNVVAKLNKTETLTQKDLTLLTPANDEEIAWIGSEEELGDKGPSGREMLMSSLSASAGKVGSIIKGPMSVWIILLIIAIVLGAGYAVYSLINKDGKGELKQPEAKPITPQTTHTTPAQETPKTGTLPYQVKTVNQPTPTAPNTPQSNTNQVIH